MHERLNLAYGWVLILFGIVVRLLLWPLNQKAMESGIRMQAVAPLLKETQDKYKNDPERLQREMLRIYKEHKVNPFGGCLPMLLPMPVLLALFFVFANTKKSASSTGIGSSMGRQPPNGFTLCSL